jgi:hypothetical protein
LDLLMKFGKNRMKKVMRKTKKGERKRKSLKIM